MTVFPHILNLAQAGARTLSWAAAGCWISAPPRAWRPCWLLLGWNGAEGHLFPSLTWDLWDPDLLTAAAIAPVAEGLYLDDVVLVKGQGEFHRGPVGFNHWCAALPVPPVQNLWESDEEALMNSRSTHCCRSVWSDPCSSLTLSTQMHPVTPRHTVWSPRCCHPDPSSHYWPPQVNYFLNSPLKNWKSYYLAS